MQSITITLSFFSKAEVIIMFEYCPAAKGGDHALLQYVAVHRAFRNAGTFS